MSRADENEQKKLRGHVFKVFKFSSRQVKSSQVKT